jgi:hypothetical protein
MRSAAVFFARGGMTKELVPVFVRRLIFVLGGLAALLIVTGVPAEADTTVEAELEESNHSGVSGTAQLTATTSGELRVVIHAQGLVPGVPHAQHIHGSTNGGHFMCPSMESDTDGDGLLTNEEASGEYGSVFMALTTEGDASAGSGLSMDRMPVASASGHIDYERTFAADEVPEGLVEQLSEVHIVQHGIDVNSNGRYDLAGAGVSTFAENLGIPDVPEEATDPASCGVVTGAKASMPPHGGVETGGGDAEGGSPGAVVGAVGAVLLLGSMVVLWSLRSGRTRRS